MAKSKFIFLSHIVTNTTPTYGDRDYFVNKLNTSFETGSAAETSNWYFSNNHFGTHIDAPRHFVPDGKTVTDFGADCWVFSKIVCIEFPCTGAVLIDVEEISRFRIDSDVELLLVKTGYERYRNTEKYWNENPGFTPALGDFLRNKYPSLRILGMDFISVGSYQHRAVGRAAHTALLSGDNPILPVEDMSLAKITNKTNLLKVIILPLRVSMTNGSPVTALAEIEKN